MLKRAHWFGLAALLLVSPLVALAQGCQSTCVLPTDCAEGQFCSMGMGACVTPLALGFCQPVPTNCDGGAESPVCGCDGKTYPTSCAASVAGYSVLSMGVCQITCGTAGSSCPQGQFCQSADGQCGAVGTLGSFCAPSPTTCVDAAPGNVCGCDGKTYSTRCDAERAGVSVLTAGACPCGPSAKCGPGKFCDLAIGTCGAANATGTCTTPPTTCPPFSQPVCGCDNKTYDSACEAQKAQISQFVKGGCPCGGPNGTLCATDEYCNFGLMVGACFAPNATGTCTARPKSCSGGTGPVCGCDVQTYANACEAAKGGASVGSSSACPVIPDAGAD